MTTADPPGSAAQSWPRRDDTTPHPLVEAVAKALAADHADCDAESCCQRNSGADWVEAQKALRAVNEAGYVVVRRDDLRRVVNNEMLPGAEYRGAIMRLLRVVDPDA